MNSENDHRKFGDDEFASGCSTGMPPDLDDEIEKIVAHAMILYWNDPNDWYEEMFDPEMLEMDGITREEMEGIISRNKDLIQNTEKTTRILMNGIKDEVKR